MAEDNEYLIGVPLPKFKRIYRNRTFFAIGPSSGYCLGPWPQLASCEMTASGVWTPCVEATAKILSAFKIEGYVCPLPILPIGLSPIKCLRSLPGDAWCERATGQEYMPWVMDDYQGVGLKMKGRYIDHWVDFQRNIPSEQRVAAKRFGGQIIAAFRLLAACPEMIGLSWANPAVFIALAVRVNRWKTDELPISELKKLSNRRRVAILEKCNLPATDAVWRFLGKLPTKLIDCDSLLSLAKALTEPVFGHCLPHLRRLGSGLVRLLKNEHYWPFLTPSLLTQIAAKEELNTRKANREIQLFLWQLRVYHEEHCYGGGRLQRLRSIGEFESMANLLRYGSKRAPKIDEYDETGFPPAPLPGVKNLEPINCVGDLVKEGREQGTCAGQRWQIKDVLSGSKFFYRLTFPERATVMVERENSEAPWVITEIRLAENKQPRFSTVKWVVAQLKIPASPAWYPRSAWWMEGDHPFPFTAPTAALEGSGLAGASTLS